VKLVIETEGIALEGALRSWVGATVAFGVWHHALASPQARVRIERVDPGGGAPCFRCGLCVETAERGRVVAGATGASVENAVQKATDLMEAGLFGAGGPSPAAAPPSPVRDRLAA